MNYTQQSIFIVAFTLLTFTLSAQPRLSLEAIQIDNMPAIHSGVCVQRQGKCVMIGGRTNGLHAFQGAQLFAQYTQNRSIYVVDFQSRQIWSASISAFPATLREQLTGSNMEWVLRGRSLYIFGGYGYTAKTDDWITFPLVTAVDIDSLIAQVMTSSLSPAIFRQSTDERFALCGGHADQSNTSGPIRLVFGQRFDGIYNKDTIGDFIQHYSYGERRFELDSNLNILNFHITVDSAEGRRRDYNLVSHYDGDTTFSVAFAGVFRNPSNLPYTTAVEFAGDSMHVVPAFQQKFSHYESAVVPVWDEESGVQHNYFIGGMACWYLYGFVPVYDSLVPFVNTISCVTRSAYGAYTERVVDTLAQYMGTNATFIPDPSSVVDPSSDIVKLQPDARTFVGYILGGIVSPRKHVSRVDPQMSNASNAVYKVFLDSRLSDVPDIQHFENAMSVYQSSTSRELDISITSNTNQDGRLEIRNLNGEQCTDVMHLTLHTGSNSIHLQPSSCTSGFYTMTFQSNSCSMHSKFIIVR